MNSRDLVLASTATVFGVLISTIAFHFMSSSSKAKRNKRSPAELLEQNGLHKSSSQSPFDPSKRKGYLSWDDYFMAVAFLSAKRSKDPNRQVGACLVSHDGIILGIGYNGFPRGCADEKLPWAKKSVTGDALETKYPYVCHAEVNAILNTNHASAEGQKLYVTMYPCNECAKVIIQSGVSEVIYFVEKRFSNDIVYTASQKLLKMAGVKVRRHQPQMSQILLKFDEEL
ncbi:hypothetical protein MKW98_018001 [Papaver atlanticum]|uniref:dCMP deaminase n=1 Tax=Papaver atlanticum TaxID=357466 RepID=A0AAD4TF50_9MAGN|nr:hypothetical protein MKW98_018001 [Papaver atlanticum]